MRSIYDIISALHYRRQKENYNEAAFRELSVSFIQ